MLVSISILVEKRLSFNDIYQKIRKARTRIKRCLILLLRLELYQPRPTMRKFLIAEIVAEDFALLLPISISLFR
jgi:hypothetical protein